MSNVVARDPHEVIGIDKSVYQALKNSLYPGAKDDSIAMVISYCKAANLDPMLKPVHIVPMYVKDAKTGQGEMRDVIMPGIGLYRIQASRSGCAGISEPTFGEEVTEEIGGVKITYPKWCSVTVKRLIAGNVVEFSSKEFWKENYASAGKDKPQPNAMWKKRPSGQLAKCAEAQALRKAFPEIGSAPTAEEMEGKSLYENEVIDSVKNSTDKNNLESRILANLKPRQDETNYLLASPANAKRLRESIDSVTGEISSSSNNSPFTFEELKTKMENSSNTDQLTEAASLISDLQLSPDKTEELRSIYRTRLKAIKG